MIECKITEEEADEIKEFALSKKYRLRKKDDIEKLKRDINYFVELWETSFEIHEKSFVALRMIQLMGSVDNFRKGCLFNIFKCKKKIIQIENKDTLGKQPQIKKQKERS
ncbi:MAG: hypothetical protein EPN37_07130 [Chitinophagaceae bacterium]|nr:MAG: hypothetical protein EPN37_07130 [Chitinophagaceae bacterium]